MSLISIKLNPCFITQEVFKYEHVRIVPCCTSFLFKVPGITRTAEIVKSALFIILYLYGYIIKHLYENVFTNKCYKTFSGVDTVDISK